MSSIVNGTRCRSKQDSHPSDMTPSYDIIASDERDVVLHIIPNARHHHHKRELCECMLGIVAGQVDQAGGRLIVQGLVPDGPAMRADVKIGEWLMFLNGLEITVDNMNDVLSTITGPSDVRLTLCKLRIKCEVEQNLCGNSSLACQAEPPRDNQRTSLMKSLHGVMYVCMATNSESSSSDLLYNFPSDSHKMADMRGLFVTLGQLLLDVTNSMPIASTLSLGAETIHVGYCRENRELMLLTVPAEHMSVFELNQLVNDVTRNLKVLYGSLHRAFSEQTHHPAVDRLLTFIFHSRQLHVLKPFKQSEPLCDVIPGVRTLTLPDDTKMIINNCLNEFQSADFGDMSDSYYGMRRQYSIIGTCLFYKGYLIANHLHRDDLHDAHLSLCHHGLLVLTDEAQTGQTIVWHEVFPTRRCHRQVDPLICGYVEPSEARWFMMAVGMKNLLLYMLLEAGGVAEWAKGRPVRDLFLQEQARATLQQMEAADVIGQLDMRLQSLSTPSLACADWFLSNQKGGAVDVPPSPRVSLLSSPLVAKPPVSSSPRKLKFTGLVKKASAGDLSDVECGSAGTSGGSTPHMGRGGGGGGVLSSSAPTTPNSMRASEVTAVSIGEASYFKSPKKRRNLLSAMDVSNLQKSLSDLEGVEGGTLVKLTTGCENTLFHYLQLDSADGVYVCPSAQEALQVSGSCHDEVIHNFHIASLTIRKHFQHTAKLKEMKNEGHFGKFGVDTAFQGTKEYGVLFECSPDVAADAKKSSAVLKYWVVGRYIEGPYTREVYVCFHESAQQNVIEMAFKLAFGMGL